ncbi:MAG: toll/interleukin-1 receptor domain-containing protein [Candidatus Aminicenantes bacterium]|nr:MAG: toll/interleukin-1 receptor domain-containing protein [Candidatus Aminicenantes bacterium]
MERQEDFQRIKRLISRWITEIRLHNAVDFYDINRVSEDIARQLLNKIYNYNMSNLNDDEQRNYPGIDLGDKKNKISFQITSRSDAIKIKDCLQKFKEKGAEKYSNGIRFLILSDKKPKFNKTQKKALKEIYPNFNPEEHILTIVDLVQEILRLYDNHPDRFQETKSFLEKEFDDWIDNKEKKEEHKCGKIKKRYNAFLCYNRLDLLNVKQIAKWLMNTAKIDVWLDEWNLKPGDR